MYKRGILLVVSGPSGAGKGTLCRELLKRTPSLQLSVSATTRPPRPGEKDGVHYFFVGRDDFLKMAGEGRFLEWAEVYGHYYGTPGDFVLSSLEKGEDVLLEIDIQGALQVKEKIPEAVLVFVVPPSREELARRLFLRGSDAPCEIEKRLGCAASEVRLAVRYDYVVINDDLPRAVENIQAIVLAEKSRPGRLVSFLEQF